MTHIEQEKQRALRNAQLDAYHTIKRTLEEMGEEMLGTNEWNTDVVDASLEEMLEDLKEALGEEE